MSILDRYIRNTLIMSTGLVSAVIIAIQSFLSLVQQFQLIGEGGYNLKYACLFVLMQLPAQFYQLFPMIGFLGVLIGLSRLSANSELIVIRASGVSIFRIVWSVIKAAVIMIMVVTLLGEGIGPQWQQQSASAQHALLFPPKNHALLDSIWLHEGNSFTRIGVLENKKTMLDITRYRFSHRGNLNEVTASPKGKLIHSHWELLHLKNTYFHSDRVVTQKEIKGRLHVNFQPQLEVQMQIASAEQTILDLYHTIAYRQSIGLSVNRTIFSFWQRALQPVTTLILICVAVPFVFGSFRQVSMGQRIMGGVLFGFIFYLLNQLFGPITLVYQFPPILAAVLPSCLFFFIAIILLIRAR